MTPMTAIELKAWSDRFEKHMATEDLGQDPAHDLAHFKRVVATARDLAIRENARLEVVLPAAWLHDLVNVPKSDPNRSQASRLSGKAAAKLLREWNYPSLFIEPIVHAIEAHSFSAAIPTQTLEAAIVQDADRLDALGAIGIARLFSTAQAMGSKYYHPLEPLSNGRPLDDRSYALDHFFTKLFPLVETLKTPAGKQEGIRRATLMRSFVQDFTREIHGETGL